MTTTTAAYAAMARRIEQEMRAASVPVRHAKPTPPSLAAEVQRELNTPEHKGKFVARVNEQTGEAQAYKLPVPPPVPTEDEISAQKRKAAR